MARGQKTAKNAERQITHVAGYIRVSTEEQAQSGLGLDAQKTQITAMCMVNGWPEPVFYMDAGISGTKGTSKRPGLHQLMQDARDHKIDAVVIKQLDRLGRKTRLILELAAELSDYEVTLVSCKEKLDTTTAQGQFALTLFAALAQLERDMISERTIAALNEHNLRDGEMGGRMPYGYRRSDNGIVTVPEEIAVVRDIFYMRNLGTVYRDIAAALEADGVKAPRGGERWYAASVREIIENRDYYLGHTRGKSTVRWPKVLKRHD